LEKNGNASMSKRELIYYSQALVKEVVNCLSDRYADGKSYIAVRMYQSALSSALYPVNNAADGSHPLVARLPQRNLRLSNSSSTSFFKRECCQGYELVEDFFALEQLNINTLTIKTVLLCTLSSAQREHTMCASDLNSKKESQDCISSHTQ